MADRTLTLNQQIALLPASIPDTVLDFLEDFNFPGPLTTESARAAFDPEYLLSQGKALRKELEALRADLGKLVQIGVEQGGREIPGAFLLRLQFEKGTRGIGLLTRLKERTIVRVLPLASAVYDEDALRELLKNPPKLG